MSWICMKYLPLDVKHHSINQPTNVVQKVTGQTWNDAQKDRKVIPLFPLIFRRVKHIDIGLWPVIYRIKELKIMIKCLPYLDIISLKTMIVHKERKTDSSVTTFVSPCNKVYEWTRLWTKIHVHVAFLTCYIMKD